MPSAEIETLQSRNDAALTMTARGEAEDALAQLRESREGGFDFTMENARKLRPRSRIWSPPRGTPSIQSKRLRREI